MLTILSQGGIQILKLILMGSQEISYPKTNRTELASVGKGMARARGKPRVRVRSYEVTPKSQGLQSSTEMAGTVLSKSKAPLCA